MVGGRRHTALAALLVALVLTGCDAPPASAPPSQAPSTAPTGAPLPTSGPLQADAVQALDEVAVRFAHRSVGGDIVEKGLPAVYQRLGIAGPPASFVDGWLDQSDDPGDKIDSFDRWIRAQLEDGPVDMALMKLGYLDVTADTDTAALFEQYLATMTALAEDHPDVQFLHATVSVTAWEPEDNAAIERFNSLMRERFADEGVLFDLAEGLSTCPDGTRPGGTTESGEVYFLICPQYTNDGGHLNETGATVSAERMLQLLIAVNEGSS